MFLFYCSFSIFRLEFSDLNISSKSENTSASTSVDFKQITISDGNPKHLKESGCEDFSIEEGTHTIVITYILLYMMYIGVPICILMQNNSVDLVFDSLLELLLFFSALKSKTIAKSNIKVYFLC